MVFMCAHARGRTEWRSSAASASMCPATMWSMAVGGRTAAILLRKKSGCPAKKPKNSKTQTQNSSFSLTAPSARLPLTVSESAFVSELPGGVRPGRGEGNYTHTTRWRRVMHPSRPRLGSSCAPRTRTSSSPSSGPASGIGTTPPACVRRGAGPRGLVNEREAREVDLRLPLTPIPPLAHSPLLLPLSAGDVCACPC
jgi:hypothetical protein